MLETEFIPANNAESPHLMIVLHGLGDSIEGYRWLPQAMQQPGLNYLLVNAPDEYYGGFSWFPFPSNDMTPAVNRSRALLFELLDHQRDEGFKSASTFVFGFSQGCLMSVEIGMRYPHRLAGIIGISGWAHEPERLLAEASPAAADQKFLITHGSHDPILPVAASKRNFEQLRSAGMQIQWQEFPKEHTIHGDVEMNLIRRFVAEQMK